MGAVADAVVPDSRKVSEVETSLYNRMAKNAFVGFFKTAAIGGAIGLILGAAAAAAAAAFPVLAAAAPFLDGNIANVALHTAAYFAGFSGSFGAVAGIQSTRDTRQFFLAHEEQSAPPEQQPIDRMPAMHHDIPQPSHDAATCKDKGHFVTLLDHQQAQHTCASHHK